MIQIRKSMIPILVYGQIRFLMENDPNLFVFERKKDNDSVFVICSFSDKEIEMNSKNLEINDFEIIKSSYEREKGNE